MPHLIFSHSLLTTHPSYLSFCPSFFLSPTPALTKYTIYHTNKRTNISLEVHITRCHAMPCPSSRTSQASSFSKQRPMSKDKKSTYCKEKKEEENKRPRPCKCQIILTQTQTLQVKPRKVIYPSPKVQQHWPRHHPGVWFGKMQS